MSLHTNFEEVTEADLGNVVCDVLHGSQLVRSLDLQRERGRYETSREAERQVETGARDSDLEIDELTSLYIK